MTPFNLLRRAFKKIEKAQETYENPYNFLLINAGNNMVEEFERIARSPFQTNEEALSALYLLAMDVVTFEQSCDFTRQNKRRKKWKQHKGLLVDLHNEAVKRYESYVSEFDDEICNIKLENMQSWNIDG